MSPRLEFALNAAVRAGKSTLAHFNVGTPVFRKSDDSPVTVADHQAERLIREAIAQAYPGEHVVGEEEGGELGCDSCWIVDPIDGTKSFICGVPLFGTLISFEEGGEPVVGVAYFPALDEAVYAERGAGAFANGRPCSVSRTARLEDAVICSGSAHSMKAAARNAGFDRLVELARFTRTWGDAYGHAMVATGRADAMVDPIVKYWDISAMKLIVREAGGASTDFDGGANPETEAIASNGHIHDAILEAFRA